MTQSEALAILKTGANVFLTGAAGSGKTHVLREYIRFLKEQQIPAGITASTGIAATHMGGITIHSFAGIGINDTLTASDLREMAEDSRLRKRIERTQVLIIDEISMLDARRLDLVDAVLKAVRGSDQAFGGVQVVLCGDFFQLPPISKSGEEEARFAYHARAWKEADLQICYLHEQYRHNDSSFADLLNAIRARSVDESVYEALQSRHNKKPTGAVEPTLLYTHNIDVDSENERELRKLPGREFSYAMTSRGGKPLIAALQKNCLAPQTLRLKVGARVMFVKNLNEIGCVNGTLGVVVNCDEYSITVRTADNKTVSVEPEPWKIEEDGKVKAEITQYPLRLAWAITVHKSQGMSLDAAVVDLRKSFTPGMGYVALSRVRSLTGLCLLGINQQALEIHGEVFEHDQEFQRASAECVAALHQKTKKELEAEQQSFVERVSEKGIAKPAVKADTVAQTRELLRAQYSVSEIARARGLTIGTVLTHLEQIKQHEPSANFEHIANSIDPESYEEIAGALLAVGKNEKGVYPLTKTHEHLGGAHEYDRIRIVRLTL